jgi:hypothetical protein
MLASEIQERKNKKALITLVVLIILTGTSAFLINKTGNRPTVDKFVFKNIDFEAVSKIRIENDQDTVELSFANSRWRVNNEFPADRNLVTLFFATLKQAEPKREISDALADSISKAMDAKGNRVTLFSDDQPIQHLVTVGNDSKTQSFFKDPKSGKIYLMTIPGYRVFVSGIFELKTGGWRDKMVFGTFNWRNFQSLEAQFPEKPAENFKVLAEGTGLFGVQGIKTDTAKLNTFLDDVSLISVEDYPESRSLRDSLTRVKPFLNLVINDITGKQHSLKVYRENKSGVLGLWMDNQPVLFNPQQVRNIIRPKSFFIQK